MKTLRIINKSKYQAEKKTPPSKKKPKPNDNNQKIASVIIHGESKCM